MSVALTDAGELLLRQVHPTFVDEGGRITSQAFTPTGNHDGALSVARGSLVSAQEATEFHRTTGRKSEGTWAVTVGEAHLQGTKCVEDPSGPSNVEQAHALICFSGSTNERKKVGQVLARFARDRGRLFP